MPNYNYRSNDYMRRNQCQWTVPAEPVKIQHECNDCCAYDVLKGVPVAMAYIPWQTFKDLYTAEKAFSRGTIFEELDKPFMGIGGCCK